MPARVLSARFVGCLTELKKHRHEIKIVVNYAHAPGCQVLPEILDCLDVEYVAVNARVDESLLSRSREDLSAELQQVARITGVLHAISFGGVPQYRW